MDVFSPDLLSRCISCGFCLPACPTYALTGDETSSPRGRITLMRALQTGELEQDDPTLGEQSSFCLGCRACEPVCPAGVEYGALLEEWRVHQWRRRRPLLLRMLLFAVGRVWRVRVLGWLRRHARGRRTGPDGAPNLMLGCFERGLFPAVSRAALTIRPDLRVPASQGCCGALHAHNGELARGRAMAVALGETLPGTIVTTSGGCAAHLASVLGRQRVREFSEWVVDDSAIDLDALTPLTIDGRPARIALQDSCHARNGLGVRRQPRAVLDRVGEYVELPSAGACCGAAGTYSLLRPRESRAVLAPKLAEIDQAGVDYLAVVNPGCQRQMAVALRRARSGTRVLHLAELVRLSLNATSAAEVKERPCGS